MRKQYPQAVESLLPLIYIHSPDYKKYLKLAQAACVRHACAMRACVRHAQLGHCYYHRTVFLAKKKEKKRYFF